MKTEYATAIHLDFAFKLFIQSKLSQCNSGNIATCCSTDFVSEYVHKYTTISKQGEKKIQNNWIIEPPPKVQRNTENMNDQAVISK